MVLKNETELAAFCSCGCGEGLHLEVIKDDDGKTAYLSLLTNRFYSEQENAFSRFKEKLKRIWYIICNKEYSYFEIVMNESDIQNFKEFVEKI